MRLGLWAARREGSGLGADTLVLGGRRAAARRVAGGTIRTGAGWRGLTEGPARGVTGASAGTGAPVGGTPPPSSAGAPTSPPGAGVGVAGGTSRTPTLVGAGAESVGCTGCVGSATTLAAGLASE